jgi:hypothetical protein
MSIFISIPSYRDPELLRTVKSAIENADSPDDLYFGIVAQDIDSAIPNLSFVKNLSLQKMHPKFARGAGFARSEGMKLYSGQDYYIQVDSHTIFVKGWDTKCISIHNRAKEISGNDNVIISSFPQSYYAESPNTVSIKKFDKNDTITYPTKQVPILRDGKDWTASRVDFENPNNKDPEKSQVILAGFMFASGNIVEEIPYDPEICFFGEEICFSVRAWTRGWDIFSPKETIVYHFYTREGYRKIWKDRNLRNISWKDLESISRKKQEKVLCGIEQGIYGAVDTPRTIEQYEEMTGLYFKKIYGLTNPNNKSTMD